MKFPDNECPGGMLRPLATVDAPLLQILFEACTDYWILSDGHAPTPTAARDEFADVPADAAPDVKRILGLHGADGQLVAMIEYLDGYPRAGTWYLGLMMVAPSQRGAGLGGQLLDRFEVLARDAGVREILLCVLDENQRGARFWQRHGYQSVRTLAARAFGLKFHSRCEMCKLL